MIFVESNLKFSFQQKEWEVVKFDDQDNIDYHNVSNVIQGTRAVDFIGIHNASSLYFFEIKNFRKHGNDPQSRERLANGAEELTSEIAQKVRDSVACIVGGSRNSTNSLQFWQDALDIIKENKEFKIIAWIEEDVESDPYKLKTRKTRLTTRNDKLKNKLKWLTSRVLTTSTIDGIEINGLTVEYTAQNSD